jgi:hypothetical protein
VGGTVQESGPIVGWPNWSASFNPVAFGLVLWLRNLIGLFIFGLLFVWLAPALARRCTSEEQQAPFGTLGWGFLSLIIVPIIAVIGLVIGFIIGGWWIALMLMGIYWTAITIGATVSALSVGQWLFARMRPATSSITLSLLVGMVVLGLVSLIPVLGQLVAFLAAVWGLGALTVVAFRAGPWSRRGAPQAASVTSTMPPQGHPA